MNALRALEITNERRNGNTPEKPLDSLDGILNEIEACAKKGWRVAFVTQAPILEKGAEFHSDITKNLTSLGFRITSRVCDADMQIRW